MSQLMCHKENVTTFTYTEMDMQETSDCSMNWMNSGAELVQKF